MNISDQIFDCYFNNEISKEFLLKEIGICEEDFLPCLFNEIERTVDEKEASGLEELFYALFMWEEIFQSEEKLKEYVDILNFLLVLDWHYQHENIVLILQKIASNSSIDFLEKAIDLNFEYLAWDDNKAFEKKCVRAIYYIGKDKSFSILEKLCKHSNHIIREMAQRQMKKI